jgi:3-oxoacyl-[acyl-carrier protein] reductase
MDLNLQRKRVLIQGSSSGLGFAIAQAYAKEGARVAICSRSEERIRTAAEQIPGAAPFVADLDQRGAGLKLVKDVVAALGGIDVLVTNTGGPPKGNFADLSLDDWQKAFERLYMSAIESIREALPHMKSQKWGRIILSVSSSAKQPISGLTLSNAIRSGLLGLMKTLSLEVASFGVTVNAMLPGFIRTQRLKELGIDEKEAIRDIPIGRFGEPKEYAALALFLGSEQASYITGQAIACDGGILKGI